MAHSNIESVDMVSEPVGRFASYLDSEEFYDYRKRWNEPHPPALLDLIEIWLRHGNATLHCGTYENFLVTVIGIIEEWYNDDLGGAVGSVLWPGLDGERSTGERITVFSRVDDGHGGDFAVFHSVLNRTLYDLTKATQEAQERWNLIKLLKHDDM